MTPKRKRAQARMEHEGVEVLGEGASNKTMLRRLVYYLGTRGIQVELKRKANEAYPRLVVQRAEHKPVVFASGHKSAHNLSLLMDIAHHSVECGGAGMPWAEIRRVLGTRCPADVAPPPQAQPVATGGAVVAVPGPRGEGTVARAWSVFRSMPAASRKECIAAAVAQGVKVTTASAQYNSWNKAGRA